MKRLVEAFPVPVSPATQHVATVHADLWAENVTRQPHAEAEGLCCIDNEWVCVSYAGAEWGHGQCGYFSEDLHNTVKDALIARDEGVDHFTRAFMSEYLAQRGQSSGASD